MQLTLDTHASPIGDILLITDDAGTLRALDFADHTDRMHRLLRRHYGRVELQPGRAPDALLGRLTAYFTGDSCALADVVVATGGTPFQRTVWAALRGIPAGATRSYGWLAAAIGKPGSARAVGLANGANPVALVVPCHRIVGADASLTGFGGGLARKAWLLKHEGAELAATAQSRLQFD